MTNSTQSLKTYKHTLIYLLGTTLLLLIYLCYQCGIYLKYGTKYQAYGYHFPYNNKPINTTYTYTLMLFSTQKYIKYLRDQYHNQDMIFQQAQKAGCMIYNTSYQYVGKQQPDLSGMVAVQKWNITTDILWKYDKQYYGAVFMKPGHQSNLIIVVGIIMVLLVYYLIRAVYTIHTITVQAELQLKQCILLTFLYTILIDSTTIFYLSTINIFINSNTNNNNEQTCIHKYFMLVVLPYNQWIIMPYFVFTVNFGAAALFLVISVIWRCIIERSIKKVLINWKFRVIFVILSICSVISILYIIICIYNLFSTTTNILISSLLLITLISKCAITANFLIKAPQQYLSTKYEQPPSTCTLKCIKCCCPSLLEFNIKVLLDQNYNQNTNNNLNNNENKSMELNMNSMNQNINGNNEDQNKYGGYNIMSEEISN